MNLLHRAAVAAAAGACLSLAASPALAAPASTETELRAQVQQQAEQLRQQAALLEALNARLAALEHAAPAGEAPATPSAPRAADPVQAQVAAVIADTRQDDMAILQAQVAQLAATGGGGNVRWRKGGPEFRSSDGQFTFHPRGRVLVDFSSTHGSGFPTRNITGTDLASGRLGAEGQMGALGYKIDADFAGNTVSLKDTYLSWDTRLGNLPTEVYIGNKLKDRSLDGGTSGTNTPFMSRNAVASVGAQQSGYYGLGITTKVIGDGWHASLAVTGDDIGNASTASDTIAYLLRAHWNPLRGQQGFMHLGGWYWYEDLGNDVTSINKTSPVALGWNGNVRVSASSIANVTDNRAWGLEFGGVYRSLWAFGEHTVRTIESRTVDAVDQKATSIYAGWLITGERPGFSSRSGVWGTTRVLRPVQEGGIGAFELAARYDRYDYLDAARGGEGTAWTVGLNWYLNNWSRLMLNYVHWKTDNKVGSFQGPDSGNTVGVRAQVSF
ncbi:porin [Stenotrophomonas sp. 24(2023)]|uniref:OprO/OprP family phosphate-selective porin n=1 Tax=Stenotrophomonas sp. 24(2023) TaxID=3068324 RepID=UPI0027DF47B3|nr:porin [Stenotrophomonas sp. 24(2023)]WMJ68642.1 porin [Stenotrophomonas sp. 24(2023)]